jgi:hypothetical protein
MSDIICPHCKNPVYDEDALSCHFCGNSLGRASSGGLLGLMRSPGMKWVWVTLALLMLAAFVLTMF